jgi:hypothetical protein
MIAVVKAQAPRPVADLLTSAMPQLRQRLLEVTIRRSWASIVGAEVARRARPDRLQHGSLSIVVDNSPWLSELTLRSAEITDAVRQRVPQVLSLRFVLGSLPAEAHERGPGREPEPLPLSDADRHEIETAVSAIPDATLAAAARRLMTTARRFSSPTVDRGRSR